MPLSGHTYLAFVSYVRLPPPIRGRSSILTFVQAALFELNRDVL